MEFKFTPPENALREEIRGFLSTELPRKWEADPFEIGTDEHWEFARGFVKKLANKGWIAFHWPKEYGGYGATIMEQVVYNEEMAYHRAPVINTFGVTMLGPILILYGNEEQKKQHLGGITSGDVFWCQGYSEPGSGSDLASLQTRAVRDGDDYVVNGQKIWTSNAHRADWIFVLARTDPEAPKHKGISMLLVDMKTPGVSVRPLINLAGQHGFNEVFFDNVRVPAKNLVGEENRGWYIGATLLDFERSNVSGAAQAKRTLEELIAYCREQNGAGVPPAVRGAIAERWLEMEVGRYISYRVASIQAQGQVPNYEASVAKLYHSELSQRIAGTGLKTLGLFGQLRPESARWARLRGRFAMSYMTSLGATIAAGTSEIQRNIIAQRGLGLPRM